MNLILPEDFAIDYDGQIYRPVAIEPHVTKDGREIRLISWATNCPHCDEPFLVTTVDSPFPRWPRRFCDTHKGNGTVRGMRKRLKRDLQANGMIQ